ncbi:molybdopterin converting factor subunit 1 [Oceanobacillus halotolerans]|uniref:molybdopterin converting factor subunit 1 n=1 Tax=Oceanobacillus halotolerans TaxID=2663380 RepID=UPI0013DC1DE8|nr:molybdopterin converting factor subunit 1 [Oceanobacillus halotolerans]
MINVLLFAELQESLGRDKLSIEAAGISIKELKEKHLQAYELPNLDQAMIAVNEEYADETTVLEDGDVVAFIPPVSGG